MPTDLNQRAKAIVDLASGETEPEDPDEGKDPAAVALGRKGGLKGGKARAEKLSPEERSESARRAVETRWAKPAEEARRYSPATCSSMQKTIVSGDPDTRTANTSFVERQNRTMRMGMRRFTRLTNGFSKKIENHAHAVSLHYMHYNFARPHKTLTKKYGKPTTPAMAAGLAQYPWSVFQIAELLD